MSMDEFEEILLLYLLYKRCKKRRMSRPKPPKIFSRRRKYGEFHSLLKEMGFSDVGMQKLNKNWDGG